MQAEEQAEEQTEEQADELCLRGTAHSLGAVMTTVAARLRGNGSEMTGTKCHSSTSASAEGL